MTFAEIARIPEPEMPSRVNEVIEKLLADGEELPRRNSSH